MKCPYQGHSAMTKTLEPKLKWAAVPCPLTGTRKQPPACTGKEVTNDLRQLQRFRSLTVP